MGVRAMWMVLFTSESGDDYIVGPFPTSPELDVWLDVFRAEHPGEAAYVDECIADGGYTPCHRTFEVTPNPSAKLLG